MKTVKFEIQEIFSEKFTGHPSRESEHDIRQIKKAIMRLADMLDGKWFGEEY